MMVLIGQEHIRAVIDRLGFAQQLAPECGKGLDPSRLLWLPADRYLMDLL